MRRESRARYIVLWPNSMSLPREFLMIFSQLLGSFSFVSLPVLCWQTFFLSYTLSWPLLKWLITVLAASPKPNTGPTHTAMQGDSLTWIRICPGAVWTCPLVRWTCPFSGSCFFCIYRLDFAAPATFDMRMALTVWRAFCKVSHILFGRPASNSLSALAHHNTWWSQ